MFDLAVKGARKCPNVKPPALARSDLKASR
jgi:hypothetical protein